MSVCPHFRQRQQGSNTYPLTLHRGVKRVARCPSCPESRDQPLSEGGHSWNGFPGQIITPPRHWFAVQNQFENVAWSAVSPEERPEPVQRDVINQGSVALSGEPWLNWPRQLWGRIEMHWQSCDGDPRTEIIGVGGGALWVTLQGIGRICGGTELSKGLTRQWQALVRVIICHGHAR
jgi:hypothetical protein